jgi:hypothetical protein
MHEKRLAVPTVIIGRYPRYPRTTGSQLQCIIKDILYNNFIKFNVHLKSFVKIDV